MVKALTFLFFLVAIYYGIWSSIKYLMNKDAKKLKKNLLMVCVAVLCLSPFLAHFTLLKTSYSYNEMLDKRVYTQLSEELTPYNIDIYYLDTSEMTYVPMYDVDVFNGISYHSTILEQTRSSANEESSAITIRLNNKIQPITLIAVDEQSDIYRVPYNDRHFHVLLPKLRNLLDEVSRDNN